MAVAGGFKPQELVVARKWKNGPIPQEKLKEQSLMRSRYEVREWADSAEWGKRRMNRTRQTETACKRTPGKPGLLLI
jgi:hypothetical protein